MMRGAQSGGVVTFEPTKYTFTTSNKRHTHHHASSSSTSTEAILPPLLKGVRSRVVNAKRTDLSKRIRQKIEQDNCSSLTGNLHGWNKAEYTLNEGAGKLVRGFFGHTRFATSSKASFDGTHPHLWSKRREYSVYSFGSASATSSSSSAAAPSASATSSPSSVASAIASSPTTSSTCATTSTSTPPEPIKKTVN